MDHQVANHITSTNAAHTTAQTLALPCVDTGSVQPGPSDAIVSKSRSRRSERNVRPYTYNCRIPSWIYRKAVKVLIESSNNSWGVTFRTYNRLPTDAEVFQYARKGQWDKVRHLFDTGCASPFDVDVSDNTLLDIAIDGMDYDGCELLLQHGTSHAGVCKLGPKWLSRSAFSIFCADLERAISEAPTENWTKSGETFTLLIAADRDSGYYSSLPPLYLNSIGALPSECAALATNELFLSYEMESQINRAQAAMITRSLDAQTVFTVLGSDQTLHQAFKSLTSFRKEFDHRYFFAHVAGKIGLTYNSVNFDSSTVQAWTQMLAEAISFEATISTVSPFYSGLWSFLSAHSEIRGFKIRTHLMSDRAWTTKARIWIRILKNLGVDLDLYGHAEKQWLRTTSRSCLERDFPYPSPRKFASSVLAYVTYGLEVDDWTIWMVPPKGTHYEMAGAFWNFVENPEVFNVPGAFVVTDEDESEEDENVQVWVKAPCM